MPRSSTSVLGLNDVKSQQELRPRGPSAISPCLKDAFEKFEQDLHASNLPEDKYIKPPASTAKWYKVGEPCFENKLQELNIDFIALIHPIQWTIANPVGADRPAKRQKKTSCVSTGQPVPVLCFRQVAHRTSFLSRQHDVISSFSLSKPVRPLVS